MPTRTSTRGLTVRMAGKNCRVAGDYEYYMSLHFGEIGISSTSNPIAGDLLCAILKGRVEPEINLP